MSRYRYGIKGGCMAALRLYLIWPVREYLGLYPSPTGEQRKETP